MRKNILLLTGSGIYGALGTYLEAFERELLKLGYNTVVVDVEKPDKPLKMIQRMVAEIVKLYGILKTAHLTLDFIPHPLTIYHGINRIMFHGPAIPLEC